MDDYWLKRATQPDSGVTVSEPTEQYQAQLKFEREENDRLVQQRDAAEASALAFRDALEKAGWNKGYSPDQAEFFASENVKLKGELQAVNKNWSQAVDEAAVLAQQLQAAQAELNSIDNALARRNALDFCKTRTEKVYLACRIAGENDPQGKMLEMERIITAQATRVTEQIDELVASQREVDRRGTEILTLTNCTQDLGARNFALTTEKMGLQSENAELKSWWEMTRSANVQLQASLDEATRLLRRWHSCNDESPDRTANRDTAAFLAMGCSADARRGR